ncbi:MAG: hypothetical protein P4M11_13605 [Candidatus Pacebacteria bacterium]|nr:hypothetical protein [Candidatus Paceibacterota bacterium]
MSEEKRRWTLDQVHSLYLVVMRSPDQAACTIDFWRKVTFPNDPCLSRCSSEDLLALWALIDERVHGNIRVLDSLMCEYKKGLSDSRVLNYFFFSKWDNADGAALHEVQPQNTSQSPSLPVPNIHIVPSTSKHLQTPLTATALKRGFAGIDLSPLTHASFKESLTQHFDAMDRGAVDSWWRSASQGADEGEKTYRRGLIECYERVRKLRDKN